MKHLGTKRIETERLILRPFIVEDAEPMYRNWASDTEVTRYLTWPVHKDVEASKSVLDMWIRDYETSDHYQWCIELKSIGEAIGSISVVNVKEEIDSVEIGYCISRSYWGQGITSEAFSALLPIFFEEMQVNRVESRHDPNNPASGKVMEKCGLKREGLKRQGDRNNTGICDVVFYGMLKEDWIRRKI